MDVLNPVNQTSAGRANLASGTFVSDGTAVNVTLGFRPRWVKVINVTGPAVFEKTAGMAAATTLTTVAAGTTAIGSGSAIVFTDDGFTIGAAVSADTNVIHWVAMD